MDGFHAKKQCICKLCVCSPYRTVAHDGSQHPQICWQLRGAVDALGRLQAVVHIPPPKSKSGGTLAIWCSQMMSTFIYRWQLFTRWVGTVLPNPHLQGASSPQSLKIVGQYHEHNQASITIQDVRYRTRRHQRCHWSLPYPHTAALEPATWTLHATLRSCRRWQRC